MKSFKDTSFQVHTDLIVDVVNENHKSYHQEEESFLGGKVNRHFLSLEDEKVLGKKKGVYSTISFSNLETEYNKALEDALEKELYFYLDKFHIACNDSCLVIGLGNPKSTPDSLGPKALTYITITRHLFTLGLDVYPSYRPLSAISPSVMAQTGIETQEYILSLIEKIKPSFVVVIDALSSSSLDRVMKTIQITDTGIHPGSGIGNYRKEISKETIGIPVLALGVPTVVGAPTIVQNTLNYFLKKMAYQKEKSTLPQSKFLTGLEDTYKNQKDTLSSKEKEELLGEVGKLNEEDQTKLFEEVLTPLGYNLIVTPTQVDEQIEKLAKIIGTALDKVLHNKK